MIITHKIGRYYKKHARKQHALYLNINSVCNNFLFFFILALRLSENKIDNAGRPNSLRGDRILKPLILEMHDSEDIVHVYFRTLTTGFH